jgi:hypothetical protein
LQCRCTAAFLENPPSATHSTQLSGCLGVIKCRQLMPWPVQWSERTGGGPVSGLICAGSGALCRMCSPLNIRAEQSEGERERGAYSRYRADLLSVEQGPRVAVFLEMPRVCGWCCSLSLLNRRAKPHPKKKWLNWNRREEKDQTETLLRHKHQPEKAPLGTSGPLTDTKGGGGP